MSNKVLLVDDVSMFLELESSYLQLSAVSVLTARNGKEALETCREERPELVFMDLQMPVMNGAESCRAIKKDPRLSCAVVLIAPEGREAEHELCRAAGCDDIITKPLDRLAFLETARRFLPAVDRRDFRVNCRFNVKFRAFNIGLSGFAENISQNGMYLAADVEVTKGTELELIFVLPDPVGAVIQTKGRVAWLNTSKERRKNALPEGFGVQFLTISDDEREQIGRYIESLKNSTSQAWRAS